MLAVQLGPRDEHAGRERGTLQGEEGVGVARFCEAFLSPRPPVIEHS